jgi:hypothetical protein
MISSMRLDLKSRLNSMKSPEVSTLRGLWVSLAIVKFWEQQVDLQVRFREMEYLQFFKIWQRVHYRLILVRKCHERLRTYKAFYTQINNSDKSTYHSSLQFGRFPLPLPYYSNPPYSLVFR